MSETVEFDTILRIKMSCIRKEREQEERKMNNNFTKTNKLTIMAVMFALTVVFVLVTAIPNFAVSIAVAIFLPTIFTGILLGPGAGAAMGGLAGLTTMLRAIFMPLSPSDSLFRNPLVSILPRILIGLAAYMVFRLIAKDSDQSKIVASGFAGAIGMLTNTIFVVGMLYVVYGQTMVEAMGGLGFVSALGVLFTSNGIVEMVVAAVITPILMRAYLSYRKK
ncbi:MAG TPA: hypothetical protein DHN33_11400 [Eubacteriaceae bacterium]|nr:hypothetical protein [Eubacteriaceae bacterium]